MQFIRAGQVARPRHGDGMVIAGAALGDGEIVPAIAPEQVRALDQAVIAAGEDVDRLTDQLACPGIIFLGQDAGECRVLRVAANRIGAMVPDHVEEPFAAVLIVKQRGIETGRIDIDRIGPGACDVGSGDDVVVRVLEVAVEPFDVGIDQPEQTVGPGQAGCPDAAGIGVPAHVELTGAGQRTADEPPVDQIR
jgi:hypothetical protein